MKTKIMLVAAILLLSALIVWFIFSPSKGEFLPVGKEEPDISTPFRIDENLQQIGFSRDTIKSQTQNRDDRVIDLTDRKNDPDTQNQRGETEFEYEIITRIFKDPVAGYKVTEINGVDTIQIVEKGSGDRWEITLFPYNIRKVGGGEFLNVKQAEIFDNNQVLIMYEKPKTLEVSASIVNFDLEKENLVRTPLEDNIKVSTNNKNSFVYLKQGEKQTEGFLVNLEKDTVKKIWSSGSIPLEVSWGDNPYITVFTPISNHLVSNVYATISDETNINKIGTGVSYGAKPFEQFAYLLEYKKINGDQNLYFTNLDDNISFKYKNVLPEKCDGLNEIFICGVAVGIPSRTNLGYATVFPEAWYQGDIALDDEIVLINPENNEIETLISRSKPEVKNIIQNIKFDVEKPKIHKNGAFFYFINKNDFSLWMIKLN